MPMGSRMSSWPSTMNSCVSTQHLLVGGNVHRLGGFDHAGDVGGGDFVLTATMPLELKLRIWLPAMPAYTSRILQSAISSAFEGALDGVDRGFDIDDYALAHAARFMLAQAQHFEAPFGQDLGHDSHHLAGADIEGDDKVLMSRVMALAFLGRFRFGM